MLRSLTAKLALTLVGLFFIAGLAAEYVAGVMFNKGKLIDLSPKLVAISLGFALLAAMVTFSMLTRRLRRLLLAVDAFRASNFAQPAELTWARIGGDEIDDLAIAIEQLQQRIVEQLRRLESVDAQRRELLANVSHDLRTPLASVRGYIDTVLIRGDTLPAAEQRAYLETAARQSERLGHLIGNLFDLTKLEARDVEFKPEPFQPAELAYDVVQKFALRATERGVTIEPVVEPGLPLVDADIRLIERVLDNLIENAMHHVERGGRVSIEVARAEGGATVRVVDSGTGIAPEDLPNIFERFYRADRSDRRHDGAGLGLAIVRRILQLHRTDLAVASRLGEGTTFSFVLPSHRSGGPSAPTLEREVA